MQGIRSVQREPACVVGAVLANVMFAARAVSISTSHRASLAHGVSEVVATLGLLLVIFSLTRTGRAERAPAAVGAYIGAAYWFTSSTSVLIRALYPGRTRSEAGDVVAPFTDRSRTDALPRRGRGG